MLRCADCGSQLHSVGRRLSPGTGGLKLTRARLPTWLASRLPRCSIYLSALTLRRKESEVGW